MVRFGLKTVTAHDTEGNGVAGKNGIATGNGHEDARWDLSAGWRNDRDLVHEPSRLRIMAMVMRSGSATFQDLRLKLALADTEVAAHAKRLEAAGLLESTREVGGTGMVITFAAAPRGREVMEGYCDWMRDILDGLPGGS